MAPDAGTKASLKTLVSECDTDMIQVDLGNVSKSSTGQAEGQHRRHSKNLEGSWDDSKTEDGLQKALNAEPGSDDDPGRLAELKFQQQQAGGGAGPREGKLSTKSGYDALNAETPS
ncbi:hypothetical protein NCS55_01250500 [Fusarium keratoplasticum]|nr:hypothetical protein NCS55_01250500 [Fusarium keratoplasticum]